MKGVEVMRVQSKWPKLKQLRLAKNQMNDQLLGSLNWPLLETIDLSSTEVTKKGVFNLILNSKLSNLKEVVGYVFAENLMKKWYFVEEFDLNKGAITKDEIQAFVNRFKFPQLKSLNLSRNPEINDKALEILAHGEWPVLEILDLHQTKITAAGVETITIHSKWPQLKHLNLSDNELDGKGLEVISRGNWRLLEAINMIFTGETKKGFLHFIFSKNMSSLKEIKFEWKQDEFAQFLLPQNWSQLENLDLSLSRINKEMIELMVTKSNWPQLKHINLSSNDDVSDETLEILSRGNWPLLETLDLQWTQVTEKELLFCIFNSNWMNLKKLEFSWNQKTLAKNVLPYYWPQLEELDLSWKNITQHEIQVIVEKCTWPQLKHLNLSWNKDITNEGLEALSKGNWPLLEVLDVSCTGITKKRFLQWVLETSWLNLQEVKFHQFRERLLTNLLQKNWHLLKNLDLDRCEITQDEIQFIVHKCQWPQLKYLNLSWNNFINDKGFEILSQGNWPLLESLDLQSTEITVMGIKAIINRSKWPQLKHLNLSKNWEITDEGLESLSLGNWPLLETLQLDSVPITSRRLLKLILNANWPNLKVLTALYDVERGFIYNLLPQNWSQVEELDLWKHELTQAEIEAIVNRCKLPKLKHLSLGYHKNNNEEFEIWSRGDWPQLETLDLTLTEATKKILPYLLLNANWPNLKTIKLPELWDATDKNLAYCFIQKDLSLVERLELNNVNIPFTDIERIINQYKCPKLKYLNLSNNKIYDEGIFAIVQAEWPLLENLNLGNTKLSLKGVKTIANQSKWPILKSLSLSNNEISDEGLSILTRAEWPLLEELILKDTKITSKGIAYLVKKMQLANLIKLNISENLIFDEGLEIIASANWPLFEHLIFFRTQVTPKGIVFLLENFRWPNFHHLQHSLNESFLKLNETYSTEILLAVVPMYFMERPTIVIVFDTTWFNSKEIKLSVHFDEEILMLPRERLDQLESITFSTDALSKIKELQRLVWPPNLKTLNLPINSLSDERKLESFLLKKCPQLESLYLFDTKITIQGLGALVTHSDWPNLKKLTISESSFQNEELKILASAKWPFLEHLSLAVSEMTAQDLEAFVNKSDWPRLKKLDLSFNSIRDEGIEILASGKWPLLESLNLQQTDISFQGFEALVNTGNWPNLKKLNVSYNEIQDKGIEILVSAKWPLLESLNLRKTNITNKGIEILIGNRSNWSNLKRVNVSQNQIQDEGLETLISSNWHTLESLNLEGTQITDKGIEILINKSDWPNLKKLDISWNKIHDKGLEILSAGKWPLLEKLLLSHLEITEKGIENIIKASEWQSLKTLDISDNQTLSNGGLEILASGKWPSLEYLYLDEEDMTPKFAEILVSNSLWRNLKKVDFAQKSQRDYEKEDPLK